VGAGLGHGHRALQPGRHRWYSIAAWHAVRDAPTLSFSWDWFNLLSVNSFAAFAAVLSLSIFIYWGWDVCLTLSEEATGRSACPAAGFRLGRIRDTG
jgi:hypothetical protein